MDEDVPLQDARDTSPIHSPSPSPSPARDTQDLQGLQEVRETHDSEDEDNSQGRDFVEENRHTGPLAEIYGWQVDLESEKVKEHLAHLPTTADHRAVHAALLNIDLREVGDPAFPEDFCKSGGSRDSLEYPVMVQLQRVRNVSAPKMDEESKYAPRMLKLTLTDGHGTIQAVEVDRLAGVDADTPPGTKIQLRPGPIRSSHGYLFIGPESVKIFGGRVAQMVEKWDLNRRLAKHTRGGGGENAPPPWIPFGKPLDGREAEDKAFKSLQDVAKADNAEFEAQRRGAIAEAQLCGAKKIFGGGTKPMLDANVQKIIDAGFTEEQAESALKIAKNNAGRALKILQKKEGAAETKKEKQTKTQESGKGRKGKAKEHAPEEGAAASKPSGRVSLFDFLEDKLPALPESEKPEPTVNQKDERVKQDRGGDRKNNPILKNGKPGPRHSQNRQPSASYHSNRNDGAPHHNDGQRSYGAQREDRSYGGYNPQSVQPEKAPRFQKKYDGEAKRQQAYGSLQEQSYSQNFQSQPRQPQISQNMYSDNRLIDDKQLSRSFYSSQLIENITDAAANLTFESQNKYNNIRPTSMQNYRSDYGNYVNKMNFNEQNNFIDRNFRPTNYPNIKPQMTPAMSNGQSMSQSFYGYPDSNLKSQQQFMRQSSLMDQFRPILNSHQQNQSSINSTGNGFYHQSSNVPGFQNPLVNEQDRKMMAEPSLSEINWNIGDRCLAKYWEDNRYYDAEITGMTDNTVVVRFLAYGNHEEVLKADCLPTNNSRLYSREGGGMNQPESANRATRFHQPMYVPPAQRKA